MMIFMENIEPPPPLVPLTAAEQWQLRIDAIESEDIWVKDFIDRLAGVIKDVKH